MHTPIANHAPAFPSTGVILDNINSMEDLRRLSVEDLGQLSVELRNYIIHTLATHPGHLASSLGTVELTLALHYVFNTPDDKLIWDVGHQAYTHKIITGRRDQFPTIRTYGGLSGFPRMDESPFDAFGTGHSSTSISAALGMATASTLQGNTRRQHIAVIGDGSMTGGQAFEALNNAGVSRANILVVLNDNGISIDKAVGGLSRHLTRITASPRYNRLKEKVWRSLGGDKTERDARRDQSLNLLQRTTRISRPPLLEPPTSSNRWDFATSAPLTATTSLSLSRSSPSSKPSKGPNCSMSSPKRAKASALPSGTPLPTMPLAALMPRPVPRLRATPTGSLSNTKTFSATP